MHQTGNPYRFLWFVIVGLFLASPGFAADSLKSYRKNLMVCEKELSDGKTTRAKVCFDSLRRNWPKQYRPFMRLAEIHALENDIDLSVFFAKKAIDLNPNESYGPMNLLARNLAKKNEYAASETILAYQAGARIDAEKAQQVTQLKNLQQTRVQLQNAPVKGVVLTKLSDSINTREDEFLPSLSLDGKTLIFTRRVMGNEDFFIARKDTNGQWRKAENMGYPPNTDKPDAGARLSADGHYLFYTRCGMQSANGLEGGGCDIAFSYIDEDSTWSSPQYFGYTINTTAYEGMPCLSSDNQELYFVSNREGGYGGLDIWVSRYENMMWTKPRNLGPQINTKGDEISPFIHPDRKTLYFGSDGLPGLGSSDVFVSRRINDSTWGTPMNLGAPINSPQHEGALVVDATGKDAFFAARKEKDKNNPSGSLDIYQFKVYPAMAPKPTVQVHGYLFDKYYNSKLFEKPLSLLDFSEGKTIAELESNEGDGSFAFTLEQGRLYGLQAHLPGYRTFTRYFDLRHDSLPAIIETEMRLRQPGFHKYITESVLQLDSCYEILDSASACWVDSVCAEWPMISADSSDIVVTLRAYYYSGDSIVDSTYNERIWDCFRRINTVRSRLINGGVPCEAIMLDLVMLIYNDDEHWFHEVEADVVEYY
ncbi:MAG: hypothetical protein ACR2IL_06395 [Chitinophagaceae bacterium]